MSFPENETFLASLKLVEEAKTALSKAAEDTTTAVTEHQTAIDSAAHEEKPTKATITKCIESSIAERIASRRFELAEKTLADAQSASTDAFHAACGVVLSQLAKWQVDRRKNDLKRILGDSPASAAQQQAAEKIVGESVEILQCYQHSLALNPPPLSGGAAVLARAVTFLAENR